jgi:hypothetical protein
MAERHLSYADVIQSTTKIYSFGDAIDWYKWLTWEWKLGVGIGVLGVILVFWRFLKATLPHSG